MKRGILYLVFGIPLLAVLMGSVTLYIAFSDPDPGVRQTYKALSKTSWQDDELPDGGAQEQRRP